MSKTAKYISFANHKGGTGKTTSCISVAGWLAKWGKKVLVVDFDPQANATSGLGIDAKSLQFSVYDAVLGRCGGYENVPITKLILETGIENLHLAPSEFDLSVAEVIMQKAKKRTDILNGILQEVKPLYDYILIDLPTSMGLLKINGLCASSHVVVPLDPGVFSLEAIHNLKTTFQDIKKMTGHSVNEFTVCLIRHKKYRPDRQSPYQEIEAKLNEIFDTVFTVPESIYIYRAQKEGVPISHYAPKSKVAKAYEEIAKNIIGESHK